MCSRRGCPRSKGVQLLWLPLPGTQLSLGPWLGAMISILLIVVTINAVNFADGLDGLAAGIVAISSTEHRKADDAYQDDSKDAGHGE